MTTYTYLGALMAEDNQLWRIVGALEGDIRAIKELLQTANDQRREFQGDIRTAVTEIQTLIPMIHETHDWVETDGKSTTRKVDRAHWTFIGGAATAGVIGTSPSWIGKIIAVLHAMFP